MESLREQDRQDVYIGQRGSIDFDICLDPVMRKIWRKRYIATKLGTAAAWSSDCGEGA